MEKKVWKKKVRKTKFDSKKKLQKNLGEKNGHQDMNIDW